MFSKFIKSDAPDLNEQLDSNFIVCQVNYNFQNLKLRNLNVNWNVNDVLKFVIDDFCLKTVEQCYVKTSECENRCRFQKVAGRMSNVKIVNMNSWVMKDAFKLWSSIVGIEGPHVPEPMEPWHVCRPLSYSNVKAASNMHMKLRWATQFSGIYDFSKDTLSWRVFKQHLQILTLLTPNLKRSNTLLTKYATVDLNVWNNFEMCDLRNGWIILRWLVVIMFITS